MLNLPVNAGFFAVPNVLVHPLKRLQHQFILRVVRPLPFFCGLVIQIQTTQNRQRKPTSGKMPTFHDDAHHHPTMSPAYHRMTSAGQHRITMRAGTENLQPVPRQQRIVNRQKDLRHPPCDQIKHGEPRLIDRPSCCRKQSMKGRMMPICSTAADHAHDGSTRSH